MGGGSPPCLQGLEFLSERAPSPSPAVSQLTPVPATPPRRHGQDGAAISHSSQPLHPSVDAAAADSSDRRGPLLQVLGSLHPVLEGQRSLG